MSIAGVLDFDHDEIGVLIVALMAYERLTILNLNTAAAKADTAQNKGDEKDEDHWRNEEKALSKKLKTIRGILNRVLSDK